MSIKLVDSLQSMGDFPVAFANSIECADGTDLETKLSTLGGGGTNITTLTEEEYQNLTDQEKLEGDFHCYDTGNLYYKGVSYGRQTDISSKQDDLNKIKFTMRRNGVNEPRYCLIGKSDLNQTLLMNEPYIFEGVFGSNTSSDKKSIITLSVSFKNGADKDNIFRGYADCADGFQYVDLVVTVDEENMAYAYVDFKQESSLATGSIRVPSINTEYYMDLETEFVLVDTMQGTELCRMSDYCKVITEIKDEVSDSTVWSSQKTSNELAKKLTKNYASLTDANTVIDSGNGLHIYRVMHSCLNIPVNRIGVIISNNYYDNTQYIRITQTYMTNDDDTANGLIYMRYGMSNDNGNTYTWSGWRQIGCLNDTKSSTTSTYSSSKIDEKYGAYTFGTAGGTQWLKLTLGNSSTFQPIVISDQYGGKVEITGMADDGTYKSVKLVRYSYGDWTTYSATDYTAYDGVDPNYKIQRLYYYPTNGCYYLEIRQWCTIKVSGATTKPEMVTSLPAGKSEMISIPESNWGRIDDSSTNTNSTWSSSKIASETAKKKQVMDLPYTVSNNKFSVKYSDVAALIDKYCNFEDSGVKQNAYIPIYLTCYTSNNNTLLSCFAKFEGGIYLDKVVYSSNDSSAEITRESDTSFISIELGGTITSLFITF